MVLYILTFILLDNKLEDKIFCTEWQQAFPDFSLLLTSSWTEFWYVRVLPKYVRYIPLVNFSHDAEMPLRFNFIFLLSTTERAHG
jgi:hypothetical protein